MITLENTTMKLKRTVLVALAMSGSTTFAQTVNFSPSAAGVTKSVAHWGVDTAWPSFDNVRQSIASIGAANVDSFRLTFHPAYALTANGNGTYSLSNTAKGLINSQLSLAALASSKPITLVPGDFTAPFDQNHWIQTIKATQEYINTRPGFTTTQIKSVEAFNEPDYWTGEGTPAQLNTVITTLKNYPAFANTAFPAASTLNSSNARGWYDQVPAATAGSSHLLGGSMTSYVSFMDYVASTGKTFTNPELHSLGEAIVGAEHGMTSGTFWADALRARGLFVQASDGKRLGYAENLDRQSAAAVYRGPDGKIRAFAGGVERFGRATAYRFVSDQDVYFNGIPVREYMIQTKADDTNNATAAGGDDFQNFGSWSAQGAYADVDLDGSGIPALDGYRWKIVSAATGQVMEVASSGTADGALIRSATDADGLNQKWNITRTRNGYYHLYNANSGRTAEVANGSQNNNASVRQWGTADNSIQQWYIEDAGGGNFYLRNAWSNKYLTGSATNSTQFDLNGSSLQKWRFVLANPTSPVKARYAFSGNANSASGTLDGTTTGTPTYEAAYPGSGQALRFSGDDSVLLPSNVSASNDITISALVKWDGGNNWQRIFDFGKDTTSYMFLSPQSGAGTMRFAITTTGGDGEQILDTAPLPIGQWTHLTLTLGGNTGILYVNGSPRVAGQILLNPTDLAATLNYLGKSQFAADPNFRGLLDDFQVFDYALDSSQVASLVPHVWKVDSDGSWATGSNWVLGVSPNGAGQSASFVGPFTATRIVALSQPTRLGTLNFSAASGILLNGSGAITLDSLAGSTAKINVTAGNHTIATPVNLADDATFDIATGSTLNLANTFDGGGKLLVKTGSGTVEAAQLRNVALDVQAGTMRIATHSIASLVSGTTQLKSLQISSGAILDLTNNVLAIDYTGNATALLGTVRGHLSADRIVGEPGSLVVGYGDNALLQIASVDDLVLDDSTIVLKLALPGDTNLDNIVDFTDLLALAQNYNAASNAVWTMGDSNYDGSVNFGDLLALAQSYGGGLLGDGSMSFANDWLLAQSLVPEPQLVLLAGGLGFAKRKRKRV